MRASPSVVQAGEGVGGWGARLSRPSIADWVAVAAQWLGSIYQRMKEQLLSGRYLPDEISVRCPDPDEPKGKTIQG